MDKPFAKSEHKVFAVTYDEHGNLEYIKTDAADCLLELGTVVTRRASHVEPQAFWTRVWFHIVRQFVSDKSAIAAWTREWTCEWRVNTAPVGGPILPERFRDRQKAIDREIEFLNEWFLKR